MILTTTTPAGDADAAIDGANAGDGDGGLRSRCL